LRNKSIFEASDETLEKKRPLLTKKSSFIGGGLDLLNLEQHRKSNKAVESLAAMSFSKMQISGMHAKERPWYIITSDNRVIQRWDAMILCLVVYNSAYIPCAPSLPPSLPSLIPPSLLKCPFPKMEMEEDLLHMFDLCPYSHAIR
jgi:hypothetical protein